MGGVGEVGHDEPASNWKRRRNGNFGILPESEAVVVGYGGLWSIVDEAHVSTIATHPQFRGHGWGEVLLAGMIKRALTLGAAYILEVRVSNVVTQICTRNTALRRSARRPITITTTTKTPTICGCSSTTTPPPIVETF